MKPTRTLIVTWVIVAATLAYVLAPLFRHDTDQLPKGLLAAPDLFKPVVQIDRFVPVLLYGCPLFGIRQRLLDRDQCFFGVIAGEMLDRRVELVLHLMRGQSTLSKAPEAIPQ